ncbi:MAG: shikimate dehydrogenase [Bacteroidetes bacterium]|nr:shikimate dehydrogenase [Bacteroidota bacterium]
MRKFGLIGYPLSHSFSEKYFSEKFRKENIADASYRLFPLKSIEEFPALLEKEKDLSGLSVTIPYKEKIIPFLDELDETIRAIGAVNTIKFKIQNPKSKIAIGYNTDVYGFRQSIKPFLASHHERALVLGTGGASKAIEFVLKQIGIDCVFVSREKKNIQGKNILLYSELNNYILDSHKLIVNCSPVGTFPDVNAAPEIPYEFISEKHFLYDLVYNPAETEFLKRGKEKGAMTMNGLDMLKLQAEEAWRIWNSDI